jgi:nucleoside-diphosphate-sugar epimerase
MDRSCLIVGCGYAGMRLARRLAPTWRVAALVRSEGSAARLAATGVAVFRCDLDAPVPDPVAAELKAARPAAIAYLAPPPEQGTDDPRLERFLDGLGPTQPEVLLYVSTTGVYGDTGGRPVSEASPVAPGTDRSRRRVAAERAAGAWCAARGVRHVVLRVPGIYGPGRLPLERLARGEPALRQEDAGPGNRIHVDDLVAACVAGLERPVRGVFNVTDGDHSSTTEFLLRVAAMAGLPPPPLVALAEARERISPGMLAFLVESRRVDNRRMLEELGVAPRFARCEDGIAASLAEMRPPAD